MKRIEPGIRVTIDGRCNGGKTLMMQAFAAMLEDMGVPSAQIRQLNDTGAHARLSGHAAIERVRELVAQGLWKDTPIVFLERMVQRRFQPDPNAPSSEIDWQAMPNLPEGVADDQATFNLSVSRFQDEMNGYRGGELDLAAVLLSSFGYAQAMARLSSGLKFENLPTTPAGIVEMFEQYNSDHGEHPEFTRVPRKMKGDVREYLAFKDLLDSDPETKAAFFPYTLLDYQLASEEHIAFMTRTELVGREGTTEKIQYVATFRMTNSHQRFDPNQIAVLNRALIRVAPNAVVRVVSTLGQFLDSNIRDRREAKQRMLDENQKLDIGAAMDIPSAHAILVENCRNAGKMFADNVLGVSQDPDLKFMSIDSFSEFVGTEGNSEGLGIGRYLATPPVSESKPLLTSMPTVLEDGMPHPDVVLASGPYVDTNAMAFMRGMVQHFPDLLTKFTLTGFREIDRSKERVSEFTFVPGTLWEGRTDQVRFSATFAPSFGLTDTPESVANFVAEEERLQEAIFSFRPDVLPGIKFQNSSLSGAHVPFKQIMNNSTVSVSVHGLSRSHAESMMKGLERAGFQVSADGYTIGLRVQTEEAPSIDIPETLKTAQASSADTFPTRLLNESDASLAERVDSWHTRHPDPKIAFSLRMMAKYAALLKDIKTVRTPEELKQRLDASLMEELFLTGMIKVSQEGLSTEELVEQKLSFQFQPEETKPAPSGLTTVADVGAGKIVLPPTGE